VFVRPPSVTGSDSWPVIISGRDVPDPEALAADPAAMSRFLESFIGRPDIQFIRWNYLAANQYVTVRRVAQESLAEYIAQTKCADGRSVQCWPCVPRGRRRAHALSDGRAGPQL
jgi:hypothetical protein